MTQEISVTIYSSGIADENLPSSDMYLWFLPRYLLDFVRVAGNIRGNLFMVSKNIVRTQVWKDLRKVAFPDSRYYFDFSNYIPDFEGSSACVARIRDMDIWKRSSVIFVTPDNCLAELRRWGILDGKTQITTVHGIKGFLTWKRNDVPEGQEEFASTLDGAQRFAKPISLDEIRRLGRIDLVFTGASAVNLEGVRYGKGHGYFDLEWGILTSLGVIDSNTPIVAVVHDCQVIDKKFPVSPFDTITDYVVTPTRTITVHTERTKPYGIRWRSLQKGMLEDIPVLSQLKKIMRAQAHH